MSPTGWLTDSIVDAVQQLLKEQFSKLHGLQSVTLDLVMNYNILSGQQFRNRGGGGSEALASPRQSICSEIN